MAQYGLEIETTTHIKGMQVGDSQPEMGGGNLNAIVIHFVVGIYRFYNTLYLTKNIVVSENRSFFPDRGVFRGHVINSKSEVVFSFSSINSIIETDGTEIPQEAEKVVSGSLKNINAIWFEEYPE